MSETREYVEPYVKPEECDHEPGWGDCSVCCSCEACGHDRWEDKRAGVWTTDLADLAAGCSMSESATVRCAACGSQVTDNGDGLLLHNWSKSNNCDPEDAEGTVARTGLCGCPFEALTLILAAYEFEPEWGPEGWTQESVDQYRELERGFALGRAILDDWLRITGGTT